MENLDNLKKRARLLKPVLRIGKTGLTESVLNEIKSQLKKKKLVKIKLLKNTFDKNTKEEISSNIVSHTNAEIIDSIGNIIILHKK